MISFVKNTITYAASQIGASQGHLSNILAGRRRPDPDLALRISEWTGTSLEVWLYKSEENLILRNEAIKSALLAAIRTKGVA